MKLPKVNISSSSEHSEQTKQEIISNMSRENNFWNIIIEKLSKVKNTGNADFHFNKEKRKSIFMDTLSNTVPGKAITNISDLVNGAKAGVNNKIEDVKDYAFSKTIGAVAKVGGVSIEDIQELNSKLNNTDNITEETKEQNNNESKKTEETQINLKTVIKENIQQDIQELNSKLNNTDNITEETKEQNNNFIKEQIINNESVKISQNENSKVLGEVKKKIESIYDMFYDFTHKQDTSITRNTTNTTTNKDNKIIPGIIPETINSKAQYSSSSEGGILETILGAYLGGKVLDNVLPDKIKASVGDIGKKASKIVDKIPAPKFAKNIFKASTGIDVAEDLGKTAGKTTANTTGKTTAKGLAKRLPIIGQMINAGLTVADYVAADDDKGRKEAIGGGIGSAGGAAAGAVIGQMLIPIPFLGAGIGMLAGGIIGDISGKKLSHLFSDVDDSINDKNKENPFTFKAALEAKKRQIIIGYNSLEPEAQEQAKETIKEIDERILEVTNNNKLESYLRDTIEKVKDVYNKPINQDNQDNIAKEIILNSPVEFRDRMVEIYNKDIVSGIFSADGNLSIVPKEETKVAKRGNISKLIKNDNSIIANETKTELPGSALEESKIISITNYSNNSNNSNYSNNQEFIRDDEEKIYNKEYKTNKSDIKIVGTLNSPISPSISIPEKQNNLDINNNTKHLASNTKETKIIEIHKEPTIVNNTTQVQNEKDNTISLSSFSKEESLIASEVLGGI